MTAAASRIAVTREGTGPDVLLVHGGASPSTTWAALGALSRRWTLLFAHRRGYPPSPPPIAGRQDFEVDASDLVPLLDASPHVVAHSYGALGALIAAGRRPHQVRSLTIIEPALFISDDDPEVARFRQMGDAVLANGLDADPVTLRRFLQISGTPVTKTGPLPEEVVRGVRRAHGSRSPSEARPDLEVLRDAAIPSLIVSGDHLGAMERMCDALAVAVNGQRLVAPGAGHFVASASGFGEQLDRFLDGLGTGDRGPRCSLDASTQSAHRDCGE